MSTFPIVSESSATSLLSDLRPTTVHPQTLQIINAFLDELLIATVATANSLNPEHFRYRGVQGALGSLPTPDSPAQQASLGPLGRAVVGEAELELRSWYEGHPTAQRGQSGFPPDGNGRGMVGAMESAGIEFPLAEASQLMRLKVAMLSSFAPPAPDHKEELRIIEAWAEAGGDISEETVTPAALWLTAMVEHITEHLLQKIAQVVGRDSAVMAADVQHLYTALCEDDCLYFFFKRMKIRTQIESIIAQSASKKHTGAKQTRTASQSTIQQKSKLSDPEIASRCSLSSNQTEDPAALPKDGPRPISENFYKNLRNVAKGTKNNHKRATSILGLPHFPIGNGNGNAKEDTVTDVTLSAADADFEAFLRSGETMRVSLTPSRFSTLDNTLTSPSAASFSRLPGDSGNTHQSSSESSLITASTQSSGESNRPSHRVLAGRQSWTAGNAGWSPNSLKLRPRRATIDEPLEEEETTSSGPTLMELIKASPEPPETTDAVGSPESESTQIPAVVVDPGSRPVSALTSTPQLTTSPEMQESKAESVKEVERRPPAPIRSASEGITDRGPNGTYRSARNPRTDQIETRQQSRDLANFLTTTAPPLRSASAPHGGEEAQREQSKKHKFKDLMARIGPYRRDRIDPHDPPAALIKMPWDKDRQPVSSADLNKGRPFPGSSSNQALNASLGSYGPKSLRSQRSVSSVGTASSAPTGPPSISSASAKDVLRKPSLMRKWAHSVTEPARQRRTSASSKSLTSPLLSQSKLRLSEVEEDPTDSAGASSRAIGLGLGGLGIGLPSSILESERSDGLSELEFSPPAETDVSPLLSDAAPQTLPPDTTKVEAVEQLKEPDLKKAEGAPGERSLSPLAQPASLVNGRSSLDTISPSAHTAPSITSSPRIADTPSLVQEATWPMPPEFPAASESPSPSTSQGSRLSMRPLPEPPTERRQSRELPRPPCSASPTTATSPRAFSKQEFPVPAPTIPESLEPSSSPEAPAASRSPTVRKLPEPPTEEPLPEIAADATVRAASAASLSQPLRHDRVAELSRQAQSPKSSPTLSQNSGFEDKIDGGYIHVSEIAPLRSMLQNASSVRECQVLVDALLTQLGVPMEATPGSDQQERVAEWLSNERGVPACDSVSELQSPNGSPKLKLKTHRSSLSAGSGKRIVSRKSSRATTVGSLSPEITMKNLAASEAAPEALSKAAPPASAAASPAASQDEPPHTLVETKS